MINTELQNEIKKVLENDGVIAYVTDTVWGLGCLPSSEKAVKKIYEIKKDNPDLRTYLGASKGRESFYERFGFITRENANLGSGMILDGFND